MTTNPLAWHFLRADMHTQFSPRERVTVGQTLVYRGDKPIELCEHGYHASVRAIDALAYAPGPICCRVAMGGDVLTGDDKLVATERTVLWMFDATNVMHEMACISAETALLIAEVDDPRCWQAIEAKRAWLRGEIDDAQLGAARAAAWKATWRAAASRVAASRAAASAVADDAAVWVARNAERGAAKAAASAARHAAAEDAARAEQNYVFEKLLTEAGAPSPTGAKQ